MSNVKDEIEKIRIETERMKQELTEKMNYLDAREGTLKLIGVCEDEGHDWVLSDYPKSGAGSQQKVGVTDNHGDFSISCSVCGAYFYTKAKTPIYIFNKTLHGEARYTMPRLTLKQFIQDIRVTDGVLESEEEGEEEE